MIVALRALHLHAEEEPRRQGGRRDRVLIEMRQHKIRGRILLGGPHGRDQRVHNFVPGDIGGKTVAQELIQLVAADTGSPGLSSHQQVGPHGGPIPCVAGIPQQPIDDGPSLVLVATA